VIDLVAQGLLEIRLEVLPTLVVAEVSVAALVDLMMIITFATKPLENSKTSSGSKAIGFLCLYAAFRN